MITNMPKINIRNNIISTNQQIIFSNENKEKIINLLKKNELNIFNKKNVNSLIKMVSNENKEKIKILLNKVQELKYNNLNEENKKIINELLKIRELLKMNINKGFSENNNINNIDDITRMIEIVHKYFHVLPKDIEEIFKDKFKDFFRENIEKNEKEKEKEKENILIKIQSFNISKEERNILKKKLNFRKCYMYNDDGTILKDEIVIKPEIYNKKFSGDFKINMKILGSGGYATVYDDIFLIKKSTEEKLESVIFKIIKKPNYKPGKGSLEYNGLIFNICLLAYLKLNSSDEKKYFCDLYEFGFFGNESQYYALMENGGNTLYSISFPESNKKLTDILIIIKECAKSIEVLHKIGIIHCDIKSDNFLFKEKDGNYSIKIIDFGLINKNGSNYTYSPQCSLPDEMMEKNKNNIYTITKKYDIYPLGQVFLMLLCKKLNITKKNDAITKYDILIKLHEVLDSNLDKTIIKNFIDNIDDVLVRILYLKKSYDNLSEFIKAIDLLIKMFNLYKLKIK